MPFAAGGGTDLIARVLAERLSETLRQRFVVINRPGASTNIGTAAVANAPADGYTLLLTSISLAANPSLYRKLAFDPQRDLAPIVLIANSPSILVVNPSLPVNSLGELIAHLKARPGELNYASYGAGSGPHLAAGLLQDITGTRMQHVPYGGGNPATMAVLRGEVHLLLAGSLAVLPLIQSGGLKALAIAAEAARRGAARRTDLPRAGHRLCDRHVVRVACAGEDAARDHRAAQSRGAGGIAWRRRARAHRRAGRRRGGRLAGGLREVPEGRDRAAVGRHPACEYPAGLNREHRVSGKRLAQEEAEGPSLQGDRRLIPMSDISRATYGEKG